MTTVQRFVSFLLYLTVFETFLSHFFMQNMLGTMLAQMGYAMLDLSTTTKLASHPPMSVGVSDAKLLLTMLFHSWSQINFIR